MEKKWQQLIYADREKYFKEIKVKEFKANKKSLINTKYHISKKNIMNLKKNNINGDINRLLIKQKINRKNKSNSFFYFPNQKDSSLAL